MKTNPYLYSMIDASTLAELLEAFYVCMNIPIQVIDENGNVLISFGSRLAFCKQFQQYSPKEDSCQQLHLKECQRSVSFGGSYIFSCHANLNHIAFPFLIKGAFFGAVLVGPFLMETPDSLLILDIAKRYQHPIESILDLYEKTTDIPLLSPQVVTQIGRLISFMFQGLIQDSRLEFIVSQSKLTQQSKINESIQRYKSSDTNIATLYPYEKEKALLTKVRTGDLAEAKGILNELLGYVLFSQGNHLEEVKVRAIELSSLLSRTAIEGGASSNNILKINNQFLMSLSNTNHFEDLCLKLQEIVEVFTESMFNHLPDKNNDFIKRSIGYISHHFSENLTLEQVAKQVHLNPAYFSTLFKQSCGSSFKEYLNMVRIEESKRLLANTDYSIIDIAVAVGFEDQSYFSKVFKKLTGLTPRQYR